MSQQKEDEASFVIGKTTLDMVLKVMHLVRKLDKMSHLNFRSPMNDQNTKWT